MNSKSSSSNTGWKGIYQRPKTGKYEAQIRTLHPKKKSKQRISKIHIGVYDTLIEAKMAREKFIAELF